MGGSVASSAHVTSTSPSVESPFTTSISYVAFHVKISHARTVTGEMSWAEQLRNRGCHVCTRGGGGVVPPRGPEDVVHHAPAGQPHPSLHSNPKQQQLPKSGHVLPALPVQQAEAVLELQGQGGSRCVVFGLTPE